MNIGISKNLLAKGACTHDVCKKGRGCQNADAVRKLSNGGCAQMLDKGWGGSKIFENCVQRTAKVFFLGYVTRL